MERRLLGRVEAAELDVTLNPYPDLQRVHAYWIAKRQDRFAPCRLDIDPVDLVEVLPRLMLIDIEPEPLDFRYRLAGTGVCATHRLDPTGHRPSSLLPPDYGALIDAHYREAIARRAPMLHLISLDSLDRCSSYARLLLPLSEDGVRVTMLLSVDGKEKSGHPLRRFFDRLARRD